MNKTSIFAGLLLATVAIGSCTKNKDIEYADFDYQTVYFASQFPVRTVVLGEDLVIDNSLDNQKKVSIKATIGGTREVTSNVVIGVGVNETLLDRLYFSGGGPKVMPMPSSYYTLASNNITITPGNILGGVEVQLTDAFFADPLSLVNTYVIPLVMNNVQGADSILRGSTLVTNPNRVVDAHWVIKPRDYVLYAIKYVNTWHGNYLRRGKDVIVGTPGNSALDKTVTRRRQFVEQDEAKLLTTRSLTRIELPLVFPNASGTNIPMNVFLDFDAQGNCSVSASGSGYTATGTGSFVKRGDKNSWGGQDRDALYLQYQIAHPLMNITSTDTLVIRDRGVTPQYFSPVIQ